MSVPATLGELNHFLRRELLRIHPPEEADALVRMIINETTGYSRSHLLSRPETPLTPRHWSKVKDILSELKLRKPLQYILSKTEFYGLTLHVRPGVLIPRPETEELVHWILEIFPQKDKSLQVLDIGTGSGCIAIALSANRPAWDVSGCDISQEALDVAGKNAEECNVQVHYYSCNILNPPRKVPGKKYDILVSNPPYVPEREKKELAPEILRYEPHEALFVPDDDPLRFYRAILDNATQILRPGGNLFFELHAHLGDHLRSLAAEKGFSKCEIKKDLNGRDRMAWIKP